MKLYRGGKRGIVKVQKNGRVGVEQSMRIVIGIVLMFFAITLYALCRAAGEADRKMEEILSKQFTSGGGE